jgi:hydrogenase/urease accessory protein HupE
MRSLFAAVILCLLSAPAFAHDSRPLFIELAETPGGVAVKAAAPAAVDPANAPRVTLAEPCVETQRAGADPRQQQAFYKCEIGDVRLMIEWPMFNPSLSTLIRVTFASGETRTAILDPSENEWRPPAAENFEGVARSYFTIGVEHILGGIDHLLFLAGLLIVAGTPRRTLVTVSGFTIAHSLTLALVAFGILNVSVPATEAVIALSIVFLATEIARGDKSTLAWRRPALVASAFGLVHGAGFAAALGEVGLPKTETIAALLFFNIGVEAGQVAVIAAAFIALFALRRAQVPTFAIAWNLTRVAGYALGILAAYWFIERLAKLIDA